MAVTVVPTESSLRVVVVVGTSEQGDPIIKTRTYNRVKPEADAQSVFAVAQAISGLQEYPLNDIQLVVNNSLSEV
jgi:hypothetical protein